VAFLACSVLGVADFSALSVVKCTVRTVQCLAESSNTLAESRNSTTYVAPSKVGCGGRLNLLSHRGKLIHKIEKGGIDSDGLCKGGLCRLSNFVSISRGDLQTNLTICYVIRISHVTRLFTWIMIRLTDCVWIEVQTTY